jgi:uncharacterized protein (DUF1810 family)
MTLFAKARDEKGSPFEEALRKYFQGRMDKGTLERI